MSEREFVGTDYLSFAQFEHIRINHPDLLSDFVIELHPMGFVFAFTKQDVSGHFYHSFICSNHRRRWSVFPKIFKRFDPDFMALFAFFIFQNPFVVNKI